MDIRVLEEFTTLAMYLNMSTTARILNESQPALSKHLAAAERELGVRLIERKQGSQILKLTPEGEVFQQKSIEMLNVWNDLKVLLQKHQGALRILIGGSLAGILRPRLGDLRQRLEANAFPTEPRLKQLTVMPQPSLLIKDVDILIEPVATLEDYHNVEVIPLTTERVVALCHPEDTLARKESLSTHDLRSVQILSLLNPNNLGFTSIIHQLCNSGGFAPRFLSSSSYESESDMICERLAPGQIALIPESLVPLYQAKLPSACVLPVEADLASFEVGLGMREEDRERLSKLVRLIQSLFE